MMAGRAEQSRAEGAASAGTCSGLGRGLDEAEDEKQKPRPFHFARLITILYFHYYFEPHIGPAIRPSSLFGAYSCLIQHPGAFQRGVSEN